MVKGKNENEESNLPKRARTITELEERLEKLKSKSNFNLKTKLMKKSLTSKLNKKIKKKERLNKTHVKPVVDGPLLSTEKKEVKEKVAPNVAKPVFNNDGKLVFSKFDFANIGKKGNLSTKFSKNLYFWNFKIFLTLSLHTFSYIYFTISQINQAKLKRIPKKY